MKNRISLRGLFLFTCVGLLCGNLIAREIVHEVAVEEDTLNQDETSIAIHPYADSLLMASWIHFLPGIDFLPSYPEPGYGFSIDAGITWDSTGIVPDIDSVYIYGYDPSCAFDSSYAYYCYIAATENFPGPPRDVYVSRTDDLGESWTHCLVDTGYVHKTDKPYIAVDNTGGYDSRLYVTWVDYWNGWPTPLWNAVLISYSSTLTPILLT